MLLCNNNIFQDGLAVKRSLSVIDGRTYIPCFIDAHTKAINHLGKVHKLPDGVRAHADVNRAPNFL